MVVFKNMVLSGLKRDNYKELAKRMSDIGWQCTNDQCRHEVHSIFCRANYDIYILIMYISNLKQ